jgi:hypothetical protein
MVTPATTANDAAALAKAEERFKQLTGKGFTAAVRHHPPSRFLRLPRDLAYLRQPFAEKFVVLASSARRTDA